MAPPERIDHALIQRAEVPLLAGETVDGVCRNEVVVIQRRAGYRFAVDAMLLAHFAGGRLNKVVDLGTGCGIVALLLAARGAKSITAVEVQPQLCQLALRNVSLNRFAERVEVVHADLRQLRGVLAARAFDLVVSNPPYVPLRAGDVSPVSERAIARHEVSCSPADLGNAARHLLKDGGSLKLVYPSTRLVELLTELAERRLWARCMRLVHPVPSRPAKMVLVEAVKNRKGPLETLPPLYLFDKSGGPTAEAKGILGESLTHPQSDLEG